MSDTDSIKTDKSQSDLQQKYDKLAMEFAKARMQLNVLKKAYTAKTSKLDQRSIESLDQFENCKYDTMSTNSSEIQDNFNKISQVNSKIKGIDEFKSKDVQFLRQDINSMHQYIRRVLDSTNSNQINYNLIMTEIEHCKGIQNSCPNNFCEELNEELTALKCSITACLYNILYNKLESRTKISTEDSRLVIYPNHHCLDSNYKSDEDRLQKVFVSLVLHFFLSFIINLNDVLEDLLKNINQKDASLVLQRSIKPLINKLHSNSLVLEKILIYSADLKTFKFDSQHIVMENILLFISNKYIECVNFIKEFIKSDNTVNIDCSALRQNIISFMALKFPIGELVNSDECLDSANIIKKLNGAYDTVHTLLRAINILEFEYLYKYSQEDMHWHMRNPQLHVKHSKQAKEELNSTSISQNSYESIIHVYNEKLNEEINRSLSLEQEKMHWENEYKLLCKKKEIVSNDKYSSCSGAFTVENELGKCQSSLQLNDEILAREKELKCYYEKKINDLISTNKELSSQRNAYAMEITALKTRLDHSIFVRNNLEIKLHEASEHIDDLKEEFHLTSTNYETQLRAMTEHLASLNETVVLERRHIDDLNSQLKIKAGKKKSSK